MTPLVDTQLATRLKSACVAGAAFITALSILVLVGWMFDISSLRSVLCPTGVAMSPSTAIAFILVAASLAILSPDQSSYARRMIGRLLAAAVCILAVTRLVALAPRLDFGIDQLLFRSPLAENRMAPNSAASLLCLGLSLVQLDRPLNGNFWPTKVLAGIVITFSLFAITGYLHRTLALSGITGQKPMALSTALAMLIMGTATLGIRPFREPMASLCSRMADGILARQLMPATVLIPIVLAAARLIGRRIFLYEPEFGVALFTVLTILAFNLVLWRSAKAVKQLDLERRRVQSELERRNEQLDKLASAEREAHDALKATQSQLVQSEKMVSLGQMVAGVAHEINNPLSFVSNNVAVLQRDIASVCELVEQYQQADKLIATNEPELSAKITELAERVDLPYTVPNFAQLLSRSRDGLKRIQQIVSDLRNFARLDESDLNLADLNEGIRSTVNIIHGRAKSKRVEIDMQLGDLPQVNCYPAKVNQVIMNLLANAIDACNEGGHVGVRSSVNGTGVNISVSDNGRGIEPAVRGKIFDPFFTTKPIGEGTGLGLSISYGIVRDHGGRIDLESTVGSGSTFTIHLPVNAMRSK